MNNDNNSSTLQPWASFLCCTEGSTISPSALMSDPHTGNGTIEEKDPPFSFLDVIWQCYCNDFVNEIQYSQTLISAIQYHPSSSEPILVHNTCIICSWHELCVSSSTILSWIPSVTNCSVSMRMYALNMLNTLLHVTQKSGYVCVTGLFPDGKIVWWMGKKIAACLVISSNL